MLLTPLTKTLAALYSVLLAYRHHGNLVPSETWSRTASVNDTNAWASMNTSIDELNAAPIPSIRAFPSAPQSAPSRVYLLAAERPPSLQYEWFGAYVLEPLTVAGRPVYTKGTGIESLWFCSASDEWVVGRRQDVGHCLGILALSDSAVLPLRVRGTWRVWDPAVGWRPAPSVHLLHGAEGERTAARSLAAMYGEVHATPCFLYITDVENTETSKWRIRSHFGRIASSHLLAHPPSPIGRTFRCLPYLVNARHAYMSHPRPTPNYKSSWRGDSNWPLWIWYSNRTSRWLLSSSEHSMQPEFEIDTASSFERFSFLPIDGQATGADQYPPPSWYHVNVHQMGFSTLRFALKAGEAARRRLRLDSAAWRQQAATVGNISVVGPLLVSETRGLLGSYTRQAGLISGRPWFKRMGDTPIVMQFSAHTRAAGWEIACYCGGTFNSIARMAVGDSDPGLSIHPGLDPGSSQDWYSSLTYRELDMRCEEADLSALHGDAENVAMQRSSVVVWLLLDTRFESAESLGWLAGLLGKYRRQELRVFDRWVYHQEGNENCVLHGHMASWRRARLQLPIQCIHPLCCMGCLSLGQHQFLVRLASCEGRFNDCRRCDSKMD